MKTIYSMAALLALGVASAQGGPYTQLVSFGDSLSDVGNVFALSTLGHSLGIPGIEVTPGTPGYYQGRFSNGPIWVDQLAGLLGLPDVLPSTTTGGTDYAYGDATSGTGNTQTYIPNIQTQISDWAGSNTGNATQLFTVLGGANDLFDAISGGGSAASQTAAVRQAADNIAAGVQTLYGNGARHVLVANLPDLGLTPTYLSTPQATQASTLSADFDSELATQLSALESASPGLHVYSLDLNSLFNDIVGNPSTYGFTNVTASAYTGDPDFSGDGTAVADPSGYLFWDAVHPTTGGHELIARQAYALVPEPGERVLLLAAAVGGMLLLRRRRAETAR